MKRAAGVAVMLVAGVSAFAQHVGPRSGGNVRGFNGGFGSVAFPATGSRPASLYNSGFGNVAFPAFGHSPAINNAYNAFSITDPSFAARLGRTVSGAPYGSYGGNRGQAYVYVPYAYPVYGGDPYAGYGMYPWNGYDPSAPQQPNVTVIYPPQSAPVTIINQLPAPVSSQQTLVPPESPQGGTAAPESTAAPASDTGSYYLIAFKDHSIYSAVAYWVEGDTLHYFTSGNVHNQASLSLVDKNLTERLNKERGIDLRL